MYSKAGDLGHRISLLGSFYQEHIHWNEHCIQTDVKFQLLDKIETLLLHNAAEN